MSLIRSSGTLCGKIVHCNFPTFKIKLPLLKTWNDSTLFFFSMKCIKLRSKIYKTYCKVEALYF